MMRLLFVHLAQARHTAEAMPVTVLQNAYNYVYKVFRGGDGNPAMLPAAVAELFDSSPEDEAFNDFE